MTQKKDNQAKAAPAAQRRGVAREATVTATRRLTDDLVRISFDCPALKGEDLPHTDHYIKLLFLPEAADYSWPFDLGEVRQTLPRDQWPIMRTYSLRRFDPETGSFEVDFVTHGKEGLAGPWAKQAEPGDTIAFGGPGGAWHPSADYEHFVLAGDESAAPAIAAALENLPEGSTATAYIEVADEDSYFEMPEPPGVQLHWIHRDGATHGHELSAAVRRAGIPEQPTGWFIHGVAEMLKELRRFLFFDNAVPRADVSISGYWRIGMTEDQWQSSKSEFLATIEAEEEKLAEQRN